MKVINEIKSKEIDATQIASLQKLLQIFFIGELVGLPTLNSILEKFDIKSNAQQINYKKICKLLTVSKLRNMFKYIFEHEVSKELIELSQKDKCKSRRSIRHSKTITPIRIIHLQSKELFRKTLHLNYQQKKCRIIRFTNGCPRNENRKRIINCSLRLI